MDRRTFLKNSSKVVTGAGLAGAVGFSPQPASSKSVSAADKVTIALIGCKGVGWANLQSHLRVPGVECVGLCDVDQNVLDERSAEFEEMTGTKAELYKDYRKLLERKDLDAVIIATPDHWHALPMIHACQAGKQVYVEKPMGLTVQENLAMEKAAENNDTIVQVGLQQRSAPHWQQAIDFVQSGKLGKIRKVRAWAWIDWKDELPKAPTKSAPEGVDYDMWLGPAPKRPFDENHFHFTWRWYWTYGGGLMTDWGVHLLDIAILAMQADAPHTVSAGGGKYAFPDDARETPDTMNAAYEYDNFLLSWEHTIGQSRGPYDRNHGVAFYGQNGALVASRGGWEVIPEYDRDSKPYREYRMNAMPSQPVQGDSRDLHAQNFIESIRSGEQTVCNTAEGSRTTINAAIGNLAWRTGSTIKWDQSTNSCKDNPEANKLLKADYRSPWKLPEV